MYGTFEELGDYLADFITEGATWEEVEALMAAYIDSGWTEDEVWMAYQEACDIAGENPLLNAYSDEGFDV